MRALKAFALLGWLASTAALAQAQGQSTEQEAGDVSEVEKDAKGPLRDRIAPVSGHLFLKRGRFELSPSATFSIRDPFFTKYVFGGALTYHIAESLAVGLRFGYAVPVVAGSAEICIIETTGTTTTRGCRAPKFADLTGQAPGQIRLVGGLDLQWAPIYGKISLLSERFLHFDLYAVGGAALVQYVGPTATGDPATLLAPGGNIGGGMRFFVNRWITVRAELRDLIYVEKVSPLPATSLRNQLLFELGISLFFPTTFGES